MPKKKKKCNWGRYIKKEYVIMAYSPDDEYEFPVKIYLSCKEMAEDLKINIDAKVIDFLDSYADVNYTIT